MLSAIFRRKSEPLVPVQAPWPTALNPCPKDGDHPFIVPEKGRMSCAWAVGGKVTVLCSKCVWEREDDLKMLGCKSARTQALKSFTPDPNGNDCI